MLLSLVNDETVQFEPIDGTLIGTTTPVQSNDDNGLLHIPQYSMTGAPPSDGLISYVGHSYIRFHSYVLAVYSYCLY